MKKDQIAKGTASTAAKPTEANRPFLSISELAQRWDWHPESIRRAIRQNRLKAHHLLGSNRFVVPIEEVKRQEQPA